MKIPFVDLKAQYESIKHDIDKAISMVVSEASFVGGRFVEEFEDQYSELYGIKHCIGAGNGTDAIYIALKALGVGRGDEVITVANSWISTSETISQAGAMPVFVDIEPDYFNIDVSKIEEKITSRTKAIIPVHLFGHPADLDPIVDLCKKYGLRLIEDCAQAHLAEYKGKKVGLFGDIASFSFYPGKNLGAYGDAGCIITDSDDLAEKCRMIANHGILKKHEHHIEGINSRLDGIQAAILSAKLPYLKKWTEARRNAAKVYQEVLEFVDFLEIPKEADYAKHVYHLYVIRTKNRNLVREYLTKNGVSTSIHYPTPLPLQQAYEYLNYSSEQIPIASKYSKEILSLPMYAELGQESQAIVAQKLQEVNNG